jgi:hypothetical protein
MTERITKAIDIFLDAVNKGTLAKGTCVACAVGNLVAHGMGGEIKFNPERDWENMFQSNVNNAEWKYAFCTREGAQSRNVWYNYAIGVKMNISATDFNIDELAQIEFAFETNTKIDIQEYKEVTPEEIRADQIKGLEAVINVMMTFDDVKADVKEVFTNKLEPVSV